MRKDQSFDEIRVYAGIAERTGARFDRNSVRRSTGCCANVSELIRKVRAIGDGTFYLPVDLWPADSERVDLNKPWIVISSH